MYVYFRVLSLEQLDKRKKNIIAFYYIFELNLEMVFYKDNCTETNRIQV